VFPFTNFVSKLKFFLTSSVIVSCKSNIF
jgi:hypothetical protein